MLKVVPIILSLCAGIAQATPSMASGSSTAWTQEVTYGELIEYQDGGTQILASYGPSSIVVYGSGFGFLMNGTFDGLSREMWFLESESGDRIDGMFSGLVSPGFSVSLGLTSAMHHITGMLTLQNVTSLSTGYAGTWVMRYDTDDAAVSTAPEPGSVALVASGILLACFSAARRRLSK